MYHPVKMRCLQDSSTSGRATQQVHSPAAVYLTQCSPILGDPRIETCGTTHMPSTRSLHVLITAQSRQLLYIGPALAN